MAGFFSPSLNFATGIGSFVSGAAKAGSDILAHDRAQDEQLDKIRIAKFADGFKQYEDEQKSYKKEKSAFDYAKSVLGNSKAAELVLNRYRSDPKVDLESLVDSIKQRNPGITDQDQGYASPFEQSGTADLQRRYTNLQQMHGSFTNPKVKTMFTLPDAPASPYAKQADAYFGNTSTQPTQARSPNSNINEITNPTGAPIPLDAPQVAQADNFSGGAPPVSSRTIDVGGKTPSKALITINDAKDFATREAFAQAWAQQHRVPYNQAWTIAQNAMTNDKLHDQRLSEAKARSGNLEPGAREWEKNVADTYKDLAKINDRSVSDLNQLITMIENGHLQTGGPVQGILDSINRMTTPFGFDMSRYTDIPGLKPNSPADADVATKIGTLITTDLVNAAKLAPVSNYESGMMARAAPSVATNPKANLYIALSMRELANRAQSKRELYHKDFSQEKRWNPYVVDARIQEFNRWSIAAPLMPHFDPRVDSPDKIKSIIASVPIGGYYMNAADGVNGLTKKYQEVQ